MWLFLVLALADPSPVDPEPPPSPGACFGEGVWTPSGAWGAHPDGCNRRSCRDGTWTAMTLAGCRVEIREKLYFHAGKGAVTELQTGLVDDIALVLKENPELRVTVLGHRTPEEATELSATRMEAVRQALVTRGVAADRLSTEDAGDAQPLAEEAESNRRVEFLVLP